MSFKDVSESYDKILDCMEALTMFHDRKGSEAEYRLLKKDLDTAIRVYNNAQNKYYKENPKR